MSRTRPHHFQPLRSRTTIAAIVGLVIGMLGSVGSVDPAAAAPRAVRTCGVATAATYTVVAGDSWFGIATAAGTSTSALLAANDASTSAALHPGDILCLPDGVSAPTPAQAPAPACAASHTVVNGDSWFEIARAAGISMPALLSANGATVATVLHPGNQLCLPEGASTPAGGAGAAACASTYRVERGDSWFAIATAAGVRTRDLLTANDATAGTVLQPGDELCLPPGSAPVELADPCASKRTVADGDSWYAISRATGVPMSALYAANDSTADTVLHPGEQLCLPAVGFGRGRLSGLIKETPVRGTCRFANSWAAVRGGGRTHQGIDLIAAAGTPVVAVADGTLSRQRVAGPGKISGNAWYLTTSSGTYFFYAHLSAFAPGKEVGTRVRAGEVIGYVGSTGNAISPHLHFEVHPYGGGPTNPYETIWLVGGCSFDQRYEQSTW